ncbi:MAG: 2'-5' RNA ligase family protein [Proteobacteria bacterium]|nr:2'-5' RNA ligase family protein [Pseudomonadota bacterium]
MKFNIFLAALPSHDNRMVMTQKILSCETKRSPLARIHWTHTQDLHVTLGFIPNVIETDIRSIALAMSTISQQSPFMANVEAVHGYGNAIVLKIEPYQQLLNIHKKMHQKLVEATEDKYHFDTKHRFSPHITIGRVQNLAALNQAHKQQLLSLIQEQFSGYSFLIQQAALLRRLPEKATPSYQNIQLYNLR